MFDISIYIICEQQCVRRCLSRIFNSKEGFQVIGEAGRDPNSIAEVQKAQPDAVLCEVESEEDCVELVRLLKLSCPYTKIFVFADCDNDDVYNLVAAGADGYLLRTMLPAHITQAVEIACQAGIMCLPSSRRELVVSSEKYQSMANGKGCMKMNGDGNGDGNGNGNGNGTKTWLNIGGSKVLSEGLLTLREMEIYKLLVQNYSNKDIGEKLFISQPTVKSHVSSILHKLGLNNRTQLLLREVMRGMGAAYNNIDEKMQQDK